MNYIYAQGTGQGMLVSRSRNYNRSWSYR